jgi:WD40 repeat protein
VAAKPAPDATEPASGDANQAVRLWDTDTRQPIGKPLTGHGGAVHSVAFSPDGKRIVSGSDDKTVRLWNADTGRPVAPPLTGHTGTVASVAFSPDGRRVASGSDDQTIRFWATDPVPGLICDKLTANMSHSQWRDWVSPAIRYRAVCPGLPIPPD